MTRKIQAVSLGLLSLLALGAMPATSAQAAPVVTLTNTKGETVSSAVLHGVQSGTEKVVITGSVLNCTAATTKGTVADGSTWTKYHPTYENCTAFGFLGATVTTTGCDYEVMGLGAGPSEYGGETKIVCEAGKSITISAGGVCEAKIGSQTITTGIKTTNVTEGEHMHLLLHLDNSQVRVLKTKDGFGCPFSGTGESTGSFTGTTTIKAYTSEPFTTANQVNMTVSP